MHGRSDGLPIYGEVLHHFLCFTSEDYLKPEATCTTPTRP